MRAAKAACINPISLKSPKKNEPSDCNDQKVQSMKNITVILAIGFAATISACSNPSVYDVPNAGIPGYNAAETKQIVSEYNALASKTLNYSAAEICGQSDVRALKVEDRLPQSEADKIAILTQASCRTNALKNLLRERRTEIDLLHFKRQDAIAKAGPKSISGSIVKAPNLRAELEAFQAYSNALEQKYISG